MERSGSGASGERYTRSAGGKTCSLLNEWRKEKETWTRCEKRLPNDRLSRLQVVNWWKESGVKDKMSGNGTKEGNE